MPAIILEQHQSDWVASFQKMAEVFKDVFGSALLNIEHFGSTSIPGIVAKPIIDMIGLVTSLSEVDQIATRGLPSSVTCLGENGVVGRRYFVFELPNELRGHLHLFESGSSEYEDRILFRDFLQRNADIAKQYEQLKIRLASMHGDDPTAYWHGKQSFVKSIVERARISGNSK